MNELQSEIDFEQPPNIIKEQILRTSLLEQEQWVAIWISYPHVLENMRYRPMPTPPDKVKNEYLKLKNDVKKRMNEEPQTNAGFWKDPIVISYFEQREAVKAFNWRNLKELKWAMWMVRDQELKERIMEVVNDFINIEEHPEPINMESKSNPWED